MKKKNRLQQVLNAIALPFRSLKNIALRATTLSTLVSGQFGKTDVATKTWNWIKNLILLYRKYRFDQIKQQLDKVNMDNVNIMRSIDIIGARLANKLIYLKNNPICILEITHDINSYKNTDTKEYLSIELKLKLIEKIESNLPLNEDESGEKLRIILQGIKDKINGQ